MAKQQIPRLTPEMLKKMPDQACNIINRVIDVVNNL